MRALIQFIIVILILTFTAAFAALNDAAISVNFFVTEKELPLTYLLLISFLLGGMVAAALYVGQYLRMKVELRRLKKTAELQNQELANLRALPVKDKY